MLQKYNVSFFCNFTRPNCDCCQGGAVFWSTISDRLNSNLMIWGTLKNWKILLIMKTLLVFSSFLNYQILMLWGATKIIQNRNYTIWRASKIPWKTQRKGGGNHKDENLLQFTKRFFSLIKTHFPFNVIQKS